MKNTDNVEFLRDIDQSLGDVLQYKKGAGNGFKVTKITPPEVNVSDIRMALNLSQENFAHKYGFSLSSIKNWEQGRRTPEGPARTLLAMIKKRPDEVDRILKTFSNRS